MSERIQLGVDWDHLFPGDKLKIGDKTIPIIPLNLGSIASITRQLKVFSDLFTKEGITLKNYAEHKNLLPVVSNILEQAPEIIEEASNIHKDDISAMPPHIALELIQKVLEVNLKNKEDFLKNFQSLMGLFRLPKIGQKDSEI